MTQHAKHQDGRKRVLRKLHVKAVWLCHSDLPIILSCCFHHSVILDTTGETANLKSNKLVGTEQQQSFTPATTSDQVPIMSCKAITSAIHNDPN